MVEEGDVVTSEGVPGVQGTMSPYDIERDKVS